MATIIMDTMIGTQASLGSQTSQISRGFYAYGVTGRDDLALGNVYIALGAQSGIRFGGKHPSFNNLGVTQIQLVAQGAGQFRGNVIYELVSPGSFTQNTAYLIEDAGTLQQYDTRLLPVDGFSGARQPIWTAYDPNKDGGNAPTQAKKFSEPVPWDYVTMRLMRPVRTIRVTSTSFQRPPADISDATGYVNSDTWLGKKPGWWLITEASTTLSAFEGWFSVTATAYTKNNEDWQEFGILQQQQTGKFVKLDPAYVQKFSAKPYKPFLVEQGNGIVRACPFDWTSFTSLFGFSTRPGQVTTPNLA